MSLDMYEGWTIDNRLVKKINCWKPWMHTTKEADQGVTEQHCEMGMHRFSHLTRATHGRSTYTKELDDDHRLEKLKRFGRSFH